VNIKRVNFYIMTKILSYSIVTTVLRYEICLSSVSTYRTHLFFQSASRRKLTVILYTIM